MAGPGTGCRQPFQQDEKAWNVEAGLDPTLTVSTPLERHPYTRGKARKHEDRGTAADGLRRDHTHGTSAWEHGAASSQTLASHRRRGIGAWHTCSHTRMLPRSTEKQGTCTQIRTQAHPDRQTRMAVTWATQSKHTHVRLCTEHAKPPYAEAHIPMDATVEGSQTPCHTLHRHGCIKYTKTFRTKDTPCTRTHRHSHTHIHGLFVDLLHKGRLIASLPLPPGQQGQHLVTHEGQTWLRPRPLR